MFLLIMSLKRQGLPRNNLGCQDSVPRPSLRVASTGGRIRESINLRGWRAVDGTCLLNPNMARYPPRRPSRR